MFRNEPWVVAFYNEWGFYPMSGGDGTGDGGTAAPDAPAPGQVPNSGSTPPAPTPNFPDIATIVPPDFKDKPWVKETKDVPSLFKRVDGLLTEIGKRPAGIPADTAPDTEWQSFNKAFGVPEKPDDYKLSDPPAGVPKNEKYNNGIKSVFHKAGVSARQAAILEKGHNELVAQLLKEQGAAGAQADADFDKLADETFGQAKPEVLKNANLLIAKFVPEKMKTHVANLSNENLIVLAGVIEGIRKEYIAEDRLPAGGGAPTNMTADQKRAKGIELMASKAYTDSFHPDHERVVAEVKALYGTG